MRLTSSVALDQLRCDLIDRGSAGPEIALAIETGPAPRPDEIRFRWPGRYGLTLGVHGGAWLMASSFDGTFLIDRDTGTIRCFVEDPSGGIWLDILVRRVLPRVAILYGAVAVHAATVANRGGSLLLLGPSGAGKSTTSALLGNSGWQMLSDDISLLWNHDGPEAAPAATGVCVWPDSREALDLAPELCEPMPGYDGKVRFTPPGDDGCDLVPLKGIVFLNRSAEGGEPVLREIASAAGLVEASGQLIRFDPADSTRREVAATFERFAAIVGATPCYRMDYAGGAAGHAKIVAALDRLLGPA